MTAPAEASALEARVGHYYQMDGPYLVGREKVREYARAVQDYHPATRRTEVSSTSMCSSSPATIGRCCSKTSSVCR